MYVEESSPESIFQYVKLPGRELARSRGRKGGRKPIRYDDPKVQTAKLMHKDHGMSIDKICQTLKISRPTFYRYLALQAKQ